jgi:toxin ParE1/3/4
VAQKVSFRPQAQEDLFGLYRYIAEDSGPVRAGDYIARIEKTRMDLALFPQRGTRRDDIAPGLRIIGFERRVTIAFRAGAHAVEIVTIAYAGRNFESDLRNQGPKNKIDEGAVDVQAGRAGKFGAYSAIKPGQRRSVPRKPRSR